MHAERYIYVLCIQMFVCLIEAVKCREAAAAARRESDAWNARGRCRVGHQSHREGLRRFASRIPCLAHALRITSKRPSFHAIRSGMLHAFL